MWPPSAANPAEHAASSFSPPSSAECSACHELYRQLQLAHAAAEAADEAKSIFLANISHEIRTPLNGMLVSAELLLRTSLTPEQRELVSTISESGTALLSVLGGVVDYSGLGRGDVNLRLRPLWLRDVLEGSLEAVAPDAAARRVSLSYRMAPAFAYWQINADEVRVRMVLTALLSNAVKFNVAGGDAEVFAELGAVSGAADVETSTIETKAGNPPYAALDPPNTRCIKLSVRDTGVGMEPAKLQQRIFGDFNRLDTALNRQHEGLGLGLAIVGRLAKLLGGSIDVQSTLGEGSTFAVTLPVSWAGAGNDGGLQATFGAISSSDMPALASASCKESDCHHTHSQASFIRSDHQPKTPSVCSFQQHPRAASVSAATDSLSSASEASSVLDLKSLQSAPPSGSVSRSGSVPGTTLHRGADNSASYNNDGQPGVLLDLAAASTFFQVSSPASNGSGATDATATFAPPPPALEARKQPSESCKNKQTTPRELPQNDMSLPFSAPYNTSDVSSSRSSRSSTPEASLQNRTVAVLVEHAPTAAQVADSCRMAGMHVCHGKHDSANDQEKSGDADTSAAPIPSALPDADVYVIDAANALSAIRNKERRRRVVVAIGCREELPLAAHPSVVLVPFPVKHARLIAALHEALHPRVAALHAPLHPDPTVLHSLLEPIVASRNTAAAQASNGGSATPPRQLAGPSPPCRRSVDNSSLERRERVQRGEKQASKTRWQPQLPALPLSRPSSALDSACDAQAPQLGEELGMDASQEGGLFPGKASAELGALDAHHTEEKAVEKRGSPSASNSLNILVAEDNCVNQRVVTRVLQTAAPSARIDVAANGVEVLEAIGKRQYDLILMDVHMPVMDGLEATEKLRQRLPEGERPLVVALSADTVGDLPARCLAVGMVDFVAKPFKVGDMERVVQMAVGARRFAK